MKYSIRWAAVALSAAAATAAVSAQAQVVNGGFESDPPPSGSAATYAAGQTFTGWEVYNVDRGGGNLTLSDTNFMSNNQRFNANSGQVWLDLTGFRDDNSFPMGIRQTVDTIIGQAYSLTFFLGHRIDRTAAANLDVSADGSTFTSYSNASTTATGPGIVSFSQFSFDFTASSLRTTLYFQKGSGGENTVVGLDDIALSQRVVAVPGPLAGSGLASLLGLAGLLLVQRRRLAVR